jgi:type I restriction enzyme S subunit
MSGMLEPSVGDVLLNSTGTGTIGRSCTFPGNGNFIVDGHVTLMRPKSHMADGRWIEYLLRSPWGQAHLEARCFSGSTNQVELSRTELAGTAIPLPPLFEQRRIADTLDAVDRAIHTAERLVAKLGKMRQGLLHDVLTCGVTESGELRDVVRHPEHFVDSAVGRVPRGWSVEPLGARIRLQRGFDITVAEQRAGDVPVVSSSGIASYHDTAMVAGPGVVIGRKGKLGDAYYVAPDFWPHDTTLWVTEFGGNLPSFVALLLKFMRLERFDAATSVPTLNRNVVHPLPVALPPADEQERIVAQVATFDDAAATEVIALDKLRLLRAGLLDDLLTGRVRARAIGDSAP